MAKPQKENGHVDIANEIVEALARTSLSGYESRILWVIFRKTYGWHKKEDWITNTQISDMTGIAETHTSRTIKILLWKNIILKNGNKLAFQKDYDKWKKLPKGVTSHHIKLPKGVKELPKGVIKITKGGRKKLPKGVDTKETKETITKETIQKVRKAISASLKEKPISKEKKEANNIEFDQELLSWHGIDEDIYDDWVKRFPNIDVPVELIKIREYFKNNPKKEGNIKNFAIFINDWLERAEKYRITDKKE